MPVTSDPAESRRLLAAGTDVVLVVRPGEDPPAGGGSGRLALLFGDPDDPVVREAAAEMDRELFSRSPERPAP